MVWTTMPPPHPPPMVLLLLLVVVHVAFSLLVDGGRGAPFCSAYSTTTKTGAGGRTRVDVPPHVETETMIVPSRSPNRRAFLHRSATRAVSIVVPSTLLPLILRPRRAYASTVVDPSSLVGHIAPDFVLPNTNGKFDTTLDDLTSNGKNWVVLYFYPGAFTTGCTLEAKKFQELYTEFKNDVNARIVGVSVDGIETNSDFCIRENLDFYMLTDEGGKVSKAYGTSLSLPGMGTFSNRRTYIIDPKKIVRWVYVDVEGRISEHPAEVLERLKELQRG